MGAESARAATPPAASDWLAQPSKNMLANPDFELGWNGWTFDAFAPKTAKEGVEKITAKVCQIEAGAGVEGGSAMHVQAGVCLVSQCIPVEEGQIYTVSAYLKAPQPNTKVKFYLIDTGWALYSYEVTVGTEWRRYSYRVNWNKPSKSHRAYVRVDADDVLIDRVQVERGQMTPFETSPAMVGLTCDQSNVFLKADGIKGLKLKAVVDQKTPLPVNVELKAADAWGQSVWERRIEIAKAGETVLPLADLPTERLGVFHVKLSASDAAGKLAGVGESRYALVDRPAAPMSAEGFPLFGVCYEFGRFPAWLDEPSLGALTTMGMRMNRFFLPDRGESAISNDAYLAAFADARKRALPSDGLPQIAVLSNLGNWNAIVENDDLSPESIERFKDDVRKVVLALRHEIRYWEVFNEPNLWRHEHGPGKGTPSMPPQKYVPLLKAAYEAVKSVDPDLKVVGVCLNGASFEYLQQAMDLGAGKYMDVFSFHPYRNAPDDPDTYGDLLHLRQIVRSAGFKGPIINDEQYFGADLFLINGWDEETRRGYYVSEEIWAAGRTIANYVHHAAAGVGYCAFAPDFTTVRYGGNDPLFLWDLYGAYNAATRMLNNSGLGQAVSVGKQVRAWVFPEAADGPLLVLYTLAPSFKGRAVLNGGEMVVYDMMGNLVPANEIKTQGIPVYVSPVYVRFARGTSLPQIEQLLHEADFTGLGDPFDVRLLPRGDGRVAARVTNQTNRAISGTATLTGLPAGWTLEQPSANFEKLASNASVDLDFPGRTPMASLQDYSLTATVASGNKQVRKELHTSPVVAEGLPSPAATDAELMNWTGWQWATLGEAQLSRNFSPNVPHSGPEDLSARLAMGWTEKELVVTLQVTDDVQDNPPDNTVTYQHDSLQIYFDQLSNAPRPESAFDADDIAYSIALVDNKPVVWLDKGPEGRYIGKANQSTGIDADVHATITRNGNLTTYLVRFPASCLPRLKMQRGATIGFSLLLNDNDGKGRKQGLTLAPRLQEPYDRPYYFRTLVLR